MSRYVGRHRKVRHAGRHRKVRHRHVWEDCVITGAGFTVCRCACGERELM